jgi:tetratricopeptide (TPR) repeat protein
MSDCALQAAHAFSRGDLPGAERLARTALSQDPANQDAGLVLIAVFNQTGRFEEALRRLDEALCDNPDSPELWRLRVDSLRKAGRNDEALQAADRLCGLDPDSPDARFVRALCYLSLERPESAEQDLLWALSRKPAGAVLHNLGLAAGMQARHREAVLCFQKAMALEPRVWNHATALGQALLNDERPEEAVMALRRALALRPNDYSGLLLLGQALSEIGRAEEAEQALRKALEARPSSAEAHTQLGVWMQKMGRFQEADLFLSLAQELDPVRAKPLFIKVASKRVTGADVGLLEEMERRLASGSVTDEDRITLHFGLGKALNDLGELSSAFRHYDEAHRLLLPAQRRVYDAGQEEASLAIQSEVFTRDNLSSFSQGGETSERPIFVVGLIRSGTTLMEQLLSAHPEVSGAGELTYWIRNGYAALDATHQRVDAENARRVATEYLRLLGQFAPEGRHVVDKMPTNYWMAGFIHACLPNARIVHMLRDPVDVALSIWMTYLGKPPDYVNDRNAIVHAIRLHDRLQRHWQSVLPADRYMAVRYEDLTREPEPVMRRVLTFCDLEWDEACIHPEKQDRFVSTPSLYRVRQPIDSRSVGKSEKYREFLGEFEQLLDNVVGDQGG